MSEQKTDFWQDHSTRFLEMAFKRDRNEIIENPDGSGSNIGECGDKIRLFLTIQNDRIKSVGFHADGCLNTYACANALAELIEGKSPAAAWRLTPDDIVDFLETLPQKEIHCAELAAGALYKALADYHEKKRASWKRIYS